MKVMEWILRPTILGFVQFVLVVYSAISALAPKPWGMLENGDTICPRDTICSRGALELIFLAISRLSAFWMYAPLVLVFLTKCHALRSMLHNSAVSVFVPFCDEHDFHMTMGKYIAGATFVHTVFHLVRWGVQHNLEYNWSSIPGRTGWIAIIAMGFVVIPMGIPWIKQKMTFEMRKGLHYFCIIFGIAVACHAPKGFIGWVMGICSAIYILDLMWRKFCMTHKCISPDFVPMVDAVQITFNAPTANFAASGGFVLVCIPSINRWQWHPFTVFPSTSKPGHWCILVGRAGNWTEAVYEAVQKKTVGPIWIQGCFPSSFSTAEDFDNLVLVAAGTGITNALSTIQKLEGGRRLNVIWVCRQASLINYYVPQLATNVQGFTLIYYTGKSKGEELIENTFGAHVLFFRKRPDYMKAITSIIIGSETGEWIPDKQVEFADEFYRLVSPHVTWDVGYVEVFHLMRLVFNRDNAGDNKVNRAAVQQLYKAMTPESEHTDEKLQSFIKAFEWDADGTVNMDKFVGGMRRFSTEDTFLPQSLHYSSEDNCSVTSGECSVEPRSFGSEAVDREPSSHHSYRSRHSRHDNAGSDRKLVGPASGASAVEGSFRTILRKNWLPDDAPQPASATLTSSSTRRASGLLGALAEGEDGRGDAAAACKAPLSEALIIPGKPSTASLKMSEGVKDRVLQGIDIETVDSQFCFATMDQNQASPSREPSGSVSQPGSGVWSQGASSGRFTVTVASTKRLPPVQHVQASPRPADDADLEASSPSASPPPLLAEVPRRVLDEDSFRHSRVSWEGSDAGGGESMRQERAADDGASAESASARRGRRWSVASMEGEPARRRSSVLDSLQSLGRRVSNAGRRMSNAVLGGGTSEVLPAGPAPGQAASASYKKAKMRGWTSERFGSGFGSGRSVISADGSMNGRAWPPRQWGSFKNRGSFKLKPQQSFNLKRTLRRSGSRNQSERAQNISKVVTYVNGLQGDNPIAEQPPEDLSRWEVLYCGGASKAVTDILTEVTNFLGVTLMTEQFNW